MAAIVKASKAFMPTDPEEEVLVVDVVSDALEPGWESARLREDCAVEVTL